MAMSSIIEKFLELKVISPHWIRNNILDIQRAMSVKLEVENGKICNKTTMERDCRELVRFRLLRRIALSLVSI